MQSDQPNQRGSTTEWLGIFNINNYNEISFDEIVLSPQFPFNQNDLKQSETLKKIYDPETWKGGVPIGMMVFFSHFTYFISNPNPPQRIVQLISFNITKNY